MPFCTSCGKEIAVGAKYCGSCGKQQIVPANGCSKCGKIVEENEKFCSACGTPVSEAIHSGQTPTKKNQEDEYPPGGRKIIKANTKPSPRNKKVQPSTRKSSPPKKSSKKKEKSSVAYFFRTLFILVSIVLGSALIIVVVNVLFIEDDASSATNTQKTENKNESGLTDTNIPGIVDIEPGDVSHLPNNLKESPEQIQTKVIEESESLKNSTKKAEEAFSQGDISMLKQLLSESTQMQYNEVFEQIQPHMKDYAKAFEKRKLRVSTDVYKEYEFSDNSGEKYSAAFALQPDGSWKLVRF